MLPILVDHRRATARPLTGRKPRASALTRAAAQRLAERIADDIGVELVEVRPHRYAGRPGRIALYRLDGTLYALVPGGEVALGYDGAWFMPIHDQAADYAGGQQSPRTPVRSW
jgi:hypothetical protein